MNSIPWVRCASGNVCKVFCRKAYICILLDSKCFLWKVDYLTPGDISIQLSPFLSSPDPPVLRPAILSKNSSISLPADVIFVKLLGGIWKKIAILDLSTSFEYEVMSLS